MGGLDGTITIQEPTDVSSIPTTGYGVTICPGVIGDLVTVPAVAADLDFPNVVVAGIPTGATILKAIPILHIARFVDSSAGENKINAASKTLRVKKSSGAWGTDDIVAFTFDQNGFLTAASAGRGGVTLIGADVKSEVDGNATYNFRSEETNRSDAIVAAGASLLLYDVQLTFRIEFSV